MVNVDEAPVADSATELVRIAADLRATIRGYQIEIERERRLPPRLADQLRDSGLYRLLVPRRLGGAQVDLLTFFRLIELVSEGDGAVGWNLSTSSAVCTAALTLPDDGVAEIFAGGPDVRFSGTTGPTGGRAEPVAGGYRVTGRWRFGSGCREADWFGGGCQVYEQGEPRRRSDGAAEVLRVFFPSTDCTIIDTWSVTGLSGTGSHDWAVTDIFVPTCRTQDFGGNWGRWPGTLYSLRPDMTLAGLHFSAVATGIARTSIDALVELAGAKQPRSAPSLLRTRPQIQEWVGRAEALLGGAQGFRRAAVEDTWETAAAGHPVTPTQYMRNRLAASYAVDNAMEAVDLMYRAGGTTVIEPSDLLGRCWRDIHIVGQNFNVDPEYYVLAGRALLGLDSGVRPRVP